MKINSSPQKEATTFAFSSVLYLSSMGRVHGVKFAFPPSEGTGTVPYSTGGDVLAPNNVDRGQELYKQGWTGGRHKFDTILFLHPYT